MTNVGIVGAGVMGRRAIEHVAAAGLPLIVYDVVPAATRELAAKPGVTVAADLAGVAQRSDVVLMYLPGPAEVAACVAGPGGLLESARGGLVIVDQSTVDPATSQRMALVADAKSVGYLDAPVLGRPAMVGNWALPIGGRAADVDKCEPVLQRARGEDLPYRSVRRRQPGQASEPADVRRDQRDDGGDDGGRRKSRHRAEAAVRNDHRESGRNGQQPVQGVGREDRRG